MPPAEKQALSEQDRNLARLEKLVKVIEDSPTKDDIEQAFKMIIEIVLKIEKKNADTVAMIEQTVGNIFNKLKQDNEQGLTDLKGQVDELFVGQKLAEMLMIIEDKLSQVKDGKDGVPGKDGRNGRDGKDGRNGLNGKSADESEIRRLKARIQDLENRPVPAGVSDLRIRQAFKYILHTEAPTGAIDGNNTTYTVSKDIFAVMAFSLNGEVIAQLPNYTVKGKTITFSSALPAAYSGKDFEIKYIG